MDKYVVTVETHKGGGILREESFFKTRAEAERYAISLPYCAYWEIDELNKDNVKNVSHYQGKDGLEVFEVQENFIGDLAGVQAAYWCNVVKYILRFQKKNGLEDLKKARRYLDLMISEGENG